MALTVRLLTASERHVLYHLAKLLSSLMRPPHRNRRLATLGLCAVALALGAWMLLSALKQNMQFFYDPSMVVTEDFTPRSDVFRVGGLVVEGSVVRGNGLTLTFDVMNFENSEGERLPVVHTGVLPDLFREGQGVVLTGTLDADGIMQASNLLAKHDENYQPKMASTDYKAN